MNIKKITKTDYKICMFVSLCNQDDLISYIKKYIKKMQPKLHLSGFYKVIAVWRKCCVFLDVKKIDDSFYDSTLDLKIIISEDSKLYFKTNDYFIIRDFDNIRYKDNSFYVLVDGNCEKLFEKVEFGTFLFGEETSEILKNSYLLSK